MKDNDVTGFPLLPRPAVYDPGRKQPAMLLNELRVFRVRLERSQLPSHHGQELPIEPRMGRHRVIAQLPFSEAEITKHYEGGASAELSVDVSSREAFDRDARLIHVLAT